MPRVEPAGFPGFHAFRVTLTDVEYQALRRTSRAPLAANSSSPTEIIAEELSRVLTEDLAERMETD